MDDELRLFEVCATIDTGKEKVRICSLAFGENETELEQRFINLHNELGHIVCDFTIAPFE